MIDATRVIRASEAGRHCVRCGAAVHQSDGPHLCKDVLGRLNAYRQQRRTYLLRLVQGRRCPRHGTVLQVICGVRSCGMCYIAEPFRVPKPFRPWDGVLVPHFNGHGQKARPA